MELFCVAYPSPLGELTVVSDAESIVALWMQSQKPLLTGNMMPGDHIPVIQKGRCWLDEYFSGKKPNTPMPPLTPRGTAFQQEVWSILMDIPYGQTVTYGQIAEIIAKRRGINRMSSQAVGQAVGANPISILIPCHRVVGAGGKLTGYAGGIDKKVFLLQNEKINI